MATTTAKANVERASKDLKYNTDPNRSSYLKLAWWNAVTIWWNEEVVSSSDFADARSYPSTQSEK